MQVRPEGDVGGCDGEARARPANTTPLTRLQRGGGDRHTLTETVRKPQLGEKKLQHFSNLTERNFAAVKISETREDMPAKENVIVLAGTDCKETTLIRKDVDNLVQEIKENLKLTQLETAVQCSGTTPVTAGQGAGGPSATTNASAGSDYPPGALKARSHLSSRGSRASPYSVPDRLKSSKCDCTEGAGSGGGPAGKRGSWAARKRYPSMSANGKQKLDLEDPLEMLQELIRLATAVHFHCYMHRLQSERFSSSETR